MAKSFKLYKKFSLKGGPDPRPPEILTLQNRYVILNTVRSPISTSPNPGGGTIYTGSGGQVILNSRGEVITVIPSGSGSFRGFQP